MFQIFSNSHNVCLEIIFMTFRFRFCCNYLLSASLAYFSMVGFLQQLCFFFCNYGFSFAFCGFFSHFSLFFSLCGFLKLFCFLISTYGFLKHLMALFQQYIDFICTLACSNFFWNSMIVQLKSIYLGCLFLQLLICIWAHTYLRLTNTSRDFNP